MPANYGRHNASIILADLSTSWVLCGPLSGRHYVRLTVFYQNGSFFQNEFLVFENFDWVKNLKSISPLTSSF